MKLTRAAVLAVLERWRRGELDAAAVAEWAGAAWTAEDAAFDDEQGDLSLARETLFALDLLGVHLLTPDDIPALTALLGCPSGGEPQALANFARYRDAIDRQARSRELKRDPFYRPFCC